MYGCKVNDINGLRIPHTRMTLDGNAITRVISMGYTIIICMVTGGVSM